MHHLDTNIRPRLSEYECKQWLKQHVVILMVNKKTSKQHCCVPLCHSNSSYDSTLSFHRFPSGKNGERRKQWLIKIRRDEGPLFKVSIFILCDLTIILFKKACISTHLFGFINIFLFQYTFISHKF